MEFKKLGELCSIVSGGTPSRSKVEFWNQGTIPWIKIGNLKGKYVNEADEFITQEGLNGSSAKLLPKGTVLYTIFATLGEVGILEIEACTNQAIAGLSINDSKQLTTDYLYYFLKSKKTYVNDIGRGVAQNNINMSILRNFDIPVPNLIKQKEIVSILDKVSFILNKRSKELQLLDELVKARFVEMFGNPLDKNIANKYFIDCVEFNPKKSEVKDMMDEIVSFVPMECVGVDGSFTIHNDGVIRDYYKGYTFFRNDDVLLAKITPCFENGKIAIASNCTNGIGFGTTEFHVSRPIKGISNPYWIKYVLKNDNVHNLGKANMTGSAGQKRIQTVFFEKLKIYLPPIELQNQFADFVQQVDKSKSAIKKSLEETQILFDSLMQKYFG